MRMKEETSTKASEVMAEAPQRSQAAETARVGPPQEGGSSSGVGVANRDLMAAATEGKASRVAEALAKGANVNVVDERGWTPLMMATWDGHERCVSILLEANADQSARQEHGLTAEKLAEAVGQPKVLELLEAKALASLSAQKLRREKEHVRDAPRMPEQATKPWAQRQAEAKKNGYQGSRPARRDNAAPQERSRGPKP